MHALWYSEFYGGGVWVTCKKQTNLNHSFSCLLTHSLSSHLCMRWNLDIKSILINRQPILVHTIKYILILPLIYSISPLVISLTLFTMKHRLNSYKTCFDPFAADLSKCNQWVYTVVYQNMDSVTLVWNKYEESFKVRMEDKLEKLILFVKNLRSCISPALYFLK